MIEALISYVQPGSIAAELGIETGDRVLRVNGQPVGDIIDYLLAINDEYVEIEVRKQSEHRYVYEIEKDYDEDLGLEFSPPTITPIRTCKNNCVFCFVHQMPKGMRKSLYVRDDDYRLSFLSGSYITGTNLSEIDIERICKLHLSPLYISVHRTDKLRNQLMRCPDPDFDIMAVLRRLAAADISFHTQIVVCPGINDEVVLERSILDLLSLDSHVLSIAVVPVGITKYRESLPELRTVSVEEAGAIIQQVNRIGDQHKARTGKRTVYVSDELYLLANQELPLADYYEGFPQLENGVGMVRLLIDQVQDALPSKSVNRIRESKRVGIATGQLIAPVMKELATQIAQCCPHISITVVPVCNTFFGETVTVTGLITGQDLVRAVKPMAANFDELLLPANMLKQNELRFLDDRLVSQVARELDLKVCVVPVDGAKLFRAVTANEGGGVRCYPQ